MISLETKAQLVKEYNNGISTVELALRYGHPSRNVAHFLRKEPSVRWRGKKRYGINERFFDEIDSETKAYILGFFCADGHLYYDKVAKGISIELQARDAGHLKQMKEALGFDGPLKTRRLKGREYCRFKVLNKHMADTLKDKHGISTRKTYDLVLPNIQDALFRHFLRGFFDGDGCVSLKYCPKKERFICIASIAGRKPILEQISKTLYDTLHVRARIRPHRLTQTVSMLYIEGGEQVIAFLRYLYASATIYLPRKRDIYNDYMVIRSYCRPGLRSILSRQDVVDIQARRKKGERVEDIRKSYPSICLESVYHVLKKDCEEFCDLRELDVYKQKYMRKNHHETPA